MASTAPVAAAVPVVSRWPAPVSIADVGRLDPRHAVMGFRSADEADVLVLIRDASPAADRAADVWFVRESVAETRTRA